MFIIGLLFVYASSLPLSRPVSPSETQTLYSRDPAPKRNRSPALHHEMGSQSGFEAYAGGLSKRMRSRIQEIPRSDKPSRTEMYYQPALPKSWSPALEPNFCPRSAFEINSGRRLVSYTDSIFYHVSDELPRGSQMPSEVQRFVSPSKIQTPYQEVAAHSMNKLRGPNQQLASRSAFLAPRRSVSDSFFDGAGDSSKQTRSLIHRIPRENVLPKNSEKKDVAPQQSAKLSDLKALRSPRPPSPQLLAEREEEAKVRRLARFGSELSQNLVEPPASNAQSSKQQADIDISESTTIVGLCPDMCPEPERGERERRGDLDKHEQLDGDRNKTSIFIAVKKYNWTADRDPDLIRPLPVLMQTMDYLLKLLDRPYDDNFLGLYNFLWDRMRAVRMDLRIQKIFSLEAISMLEQMIRLHIIAMHELSEYNRAEGFSEGFDAHLNIEQMSKASVELFQMYEDHRRKGTPIPTENEFRCYFVLLKLDKHSGYKVGPAELSRDLARMSPEVRRSPEILFARDVAKACRLGNYISFFRLARSATYLQACLMHAHFSKLRKEALASLHSSFPSNQGMPLAQLEDMLAMEGEDIESFVQQHGLLLKSFEEMYIMRDGPFLREGPPTKRSPLVDKKKSDKIKIDVCFTPFAPSSNASLKEEVSEVARTTKQWPEKPDVIMSDSPSCAISHAISSIDQNDVSIREVETEAVQVHKESPEKIELLKEKRKSIFRKMRQRTREFRERRQALMQMVLECVSVSTLLHASVDKTLTTEEGQHDDH